MRKTVSNLLVVGTQLLIVGLFFTTILSNDMKEVKHVSTIHNNNLNNLLPNQQEPYLTEHKDSRNLL